MHLCWRGGRRHGCRGRHRRRRCGRRLASSVPPSSGVVGAGILGAGVSVEGNSEERREDWLPLILERMWLFHCVFFLFF